MIKKPYLSIGFFVLSAAMWTAFMLAWNAEGFFDDHQRSDTFGMIAIISTVLCGISKIVFYVKNNSTLPCKRFITTELIISVILAAVGIFTPGFHDEHILLGIFFFMPSLVFWLIIDIIMWVILYKKAKKAADQQR